MASSIITFPDLDNLIYYKSKYLKPILNETEHAYYILNNTEGTYMITNNNTTNKLINVEAFAVGGGGAGGYYNGNGGDGGTVIYKSFTIEPNTELELSIGKGAYYVKDNTYNNGFQVKLYEGYIIDFFETQKSYLMNMKPVDTISNGLNKMWEQKVTSISSLKTIIENDVDSEIITNINQNELCRNNPNSENCENAIKTMFAYNKGFTFNIYSVFFAPFDCEIEIEITAFKYAILFFYSDDDVKNKLFDNDLTLYQTFSNNYYTKINSETKKFKRANIKAGEQYYLKIVYTQDKDLSASESQFKVNINIITQNEVTNGNSYFKFTNSSDNFGIIYASSSTIYNKNKKINEVNALGGITGNVNLDTVNYGKGGCSIYQQTTTKKVKICGDNTNGANGVELPIAFKSLKDEPYNYSYTYGSGGGGAFWRLNGYGGKGGKNAGNGISFTNLPSISRPTTNSGGGGGGNSFLTNYSEKMLDITKLSGANGIIILKVSKKTEQILIQTFVNKNTDNSEVEKINVEIEKIYKERQIDVFSLETFPQSLLSNNVMSDNYRRILKYCLALFTSLYSVINTDYKNLSEKERLKFPISIIYNTDTNRYPGKNIVNGVCVINLFINGGDISINDINNNIINNTIDTAKYNYYSDSKIIYDRNFAIDNSLNINSSGFAKYYIKKLLNTIVDNNRLVIFIESVTKNYLYYYKLSKNIKLYDELKNLIVNNASIAVIISNIDKITDELQIFNGLLFSPIDKMNDERTDLVTTERTEYVDKQNKFKETTYNNSVKLIASNNVTNYSINSFKTKYKLNKNDKLFNIAFYVSIVIIIIVFIYTYAYFEVPLRPLVLLILLVVIFIIIGLLWLKATYDLKIYENFTCSDIISTTVGKDYVTANSPIVSCKNSSGADLTTPIDVLPYYFISNDSDTAKFVNLNPKKSLYVNVFIYGTPIFDGTNKYYIPNITIYKNVLLSNNFHYEIYNNKIIKKDGTNDKVLFSEPNRESGNINSYLNIYDCKNTRQDICNINDAIRNQLNSSRYTTYTPSGQTTIKVNNPITNNDILTLDDYDFNPTDTNNSLYEFGLTNINAYVLRQPFVVIKVTNDSIDTTQTIDETINKFKREMNLFEINSSLFLLNKNTKKIVDFTKQYHKYNNQQYADAYLMNSQIYDKNQQAYYILNREIMYSFYSKLLIAIIIAIVLCCFMLYHFNNALKIHIIVLSFIAITIAVSVIFYIINKRQHRDTDKYYFAKPDYYR